MNARLARWNLLPMDQAANEILPCCGSSAWARGVAMRRPLPDEAAFFAAADATWWDLAEPDWTEAFHSHPRIGDSKPPLSAPPQSAAWSAHEQRSVAAAEDSVKRALAEGNREYERRFHRIFIVCATGKPAGEILEILTRRLQNDEKTELQEAAEQQRQIIHIRIKKWLQG